MLNKLLRRYRKVKLTKPSEHRSSNWMKPLPNNIEKMLYELDEKTIRLSKAIKIIKPETRQYGNLRIFYKDEDKEIPSNMIGLKVWGYPLPAGYILLNFEYIN